MIRCRLQLLLRTGRTTAGRQLFFQEQVAEGSDAELAAGKLTCFVARAHEYVTVARGADRSTRVLIQREKHRRLHHDPSLGCSEGDLAGVSSVMNMTRAAY